MWANHAIPQANPHSTSATLSHPVLLMAGHFHTLFNRSSLKANIVYPQFRKHYVLRMHEVGASTYRRRKF